MLRVRFILVLIISGSLFSYIYSQNLLLNGDFEESTVSGNFQTFRVGESFNGWTVLQATVDLNNSTSFAYTGKNSIDLNGTPGVGGIEQKFRTKKGKKYKLSFYMAANISGFPAVKKMRVNVGDQKAFYSFDTRGKNNDNMGWEKHELVFKAKSNETSLQFYSTEGHENPYWGPIIDHVWVELVSNNFMTGSSKERFFDADIGLLGGMSYNFFTKNSNVPITGPKEYTLSAENGYGFHFGLHSLLRAGSIFIRPDIMLNSHTIDLNFTNQNPSEITALKARYQMLDIPVALGYNYRSFYFLFGVVGHLYIADQIDIKSIDQRLDTEIKKFSNGYQLGAGIRYEQISLDVRLEYNDIENGIGFNSNTIVTYLPRTELSGVATISFAIW